MFKNLIGKSLNLWQSLVVKEMKFKFKGSECENSLLKKRSSAWGVSLLCAFNTRRYSSTENIHKAADLVQIDHSKDYMSTSII